jgi:hypothetical protein
LSFPSRRLAVCSLLDQVRDGSRLRDIDGMAGVDLDHGRADALGHRPLSVGRDHSIPCRNRVSTWVSR